MLMLGGGSGKRSRPMRLNLTLLASVPLMALIAGAGVLANLLTPSFIPVSVAAHTDHCHRRRRIARERRQGRSARLGEEARPADGIARNRACTSTIRRRR